MSQHSGLGQPLGVSTCSEVQVLECKIGCEHINICVMNEKHTNANHLLQIGVIHVSIQDLLSMGQGHPSDTPGYIIQRGP